MSLNRSKTSDYYDYYKRLTQCLAKRTNTKVSNNAIPGLKQRENRNVRPLITKQHLQAKFLAKYNKDKQQEQETSQGAGRNVTQRNVPISFKVKTQDAAGPSKRKKPLENYINLPSSFFNSFNGPDMSIFKIPVVPPKKQKLLQQPPSQGVKKPSQLEINLNNKKPQFDSLQQKQRDPNAYINISPSFFKLNKRPAFPERPSSIATTDMTLESLNSAKFQPKRASTPLEKHVPMISDPDDEMLKSCYLGINEKVKSSIPPLKVKGVNAAKVKRFMELVDKTAKNIDTKTFSDHVDPIDEILGRVMDIYELSCQSPRLINETLMSSSDIEKENPPAAFESPKHSLPIPEFFDDDHDQVTCRGPSQKKNLERKLQRTSDLFNEDSKIPQIDDVLETPIADFDGIFSSEFPFNNSPTRFSCASQELSPFSQQSPLGLSFNFDSPMAVECDNDPFDFISPMTNISMDWESPVTNDLNNTFAIFHSPPKNVRPSQRSNHEIFNQHPDSSLSTYKWTPHMAMNLTQSTSSQLEAFQPRNIFRDNTFDMF